MKFCEDRIVDDEMLAWKQAWNISAKKLSFWFKSRESSEQKGKDNDWKTHCALLIPYVKPMSDQDWKNENTRLLVRTAVDDFISRKLYHLDMDRKHVGLWKRQGKLQAVFFDLAETRPVRDAVADKEAMLHSLQLL